MENRLNRLKLTSYSVTTLDLIIQNASDLNFSTRKDGANCYYHLAKFTLDASLAEAWEWVTKRNGFILKIQDESEVLFHGVVEDREITLQKIHIVAYGGTSYLYTPASGIKWYVSIRDLNSLALQHRQTTSESRITVGARVYDSKGVMFPSSWIKAGEIIRIRDLVPATAMLDSASTDKLRTFTIMETGYSAESATNGLMLDSDSPDLDAILARAAL